MLHEPSAPSGPDPASKYKTRLGVWMFLVYALVYGGFVGINLARPGWMGRRVLLGLNLAVLYGFGLIAFALVLAVIYNCLCMRSEREHEDAGRGGA